MVAMPAATCSTASTASITASSSCSTSASSRSGESQSDYEIFSAHPAAARARGDLHRRHAATSTGSSGCSTPPTCRRHISWKDFCRKGYFVVPAEAGACARPWTMRWFAEGRTKDIAGAAAAALAVGGGIRQGPADAERQAGVRPRNPQAPHGGQSRAPGAEPLPSLLGRAARPSSSSVIRCR